MKALLLDLTRRQDEGTFPQKINLLSRLRINLDGSDAGEVSAEQHEYARKGGAI
jgi:hypothetical protein